MATEPTPATAGKGVRYSLATMLAATAAVAYFVAPVSWLGGMYVTCLVFSCVMLGAVAIGFWTKQTWIAALAGGLALVPVLGMFVSPVLMLQALGTLVVSLATIAWRQRPGLRVAACVLVMAAAYGWGLSVAWSKAAEIDRARERWPLVSLSDRLPTPADENVAAPQLSNEQVRRLVERDDWVTHRNWGNRTWQLQQLHEGHANRFVLAQGFGVTRMLYPSTEEDRFVASEVMPVPAGFELSGDNPEAAMRRLHTYSELTFFDDDRMGYARSLEETAGFEPHAFAEAPMGVDDKNEATWRVDRLELVGLLLRDEPVVYISDRLPNMEDAANAPTRPLNDFESAALAELRGATDLEVSEPNPRGEVSMLGALRAGEACAACHNAARGTLLGAFSYELVRLDGSPTESEAPN